MVVKHVNTTELEPGMKIAESVYVLTGSGSNMLAAKKGAIIDQSLINMLTRRKVRSVEIAFYADPDQREDTESKPAEIHERVEKRKQERLEKQGPAPETVIPPIKPVVDEDFKEEALESIRQLFSVFTEGEESGNMTTAFQCISELDNVVGEFLGIISSDTSGFIHINDLKHYDEYTYHHSLSVAMLSLTTGRALGLSHQELFRLGRCAMLHDIGKQLVPLEMINKKGKLTDSEFEIIKEHPTLGANNLKANGIGDVELWNSVMFHHEKINGKGYPKQLKGKDIPLFSKIIAVADVYDAVTSFRSYRSPMLPSNAYELINSDIGMAFDYDIVKAFFKRLALYPVNTVVEFSDGRLGIVVANENSLRPVVKIWGSTEVVDLNSAKHLSVTIVKVVNPKDLPRGFTFY